MLSSSRVLLLMASVATLAAANKQSSRSSSYRSREQSSASRREQMMAMPLVAPLFIENGEFSSTITVVNEMSQATTIDVIVLDPSGFEIAKQKLPMPGHSQRAVKLRDLLNEANSEVTTGSVKIMPEARFATRGTSVLAQLSMVDIGRFTPAYLEEEFLMLTPEGSNTFRAVSSSILGSPILALESLASTNEAVTITCLSERGESVSSSLQLAPGEMKLTRACAPQDGEGLQIDQLFIQHELQAKGATGISVVSSGKPGELAAYGFGARGPHRTPSFTALNFIDLSLIHSGNTIFAGVPVGQADLFPGVTFAPEIAIANFGTKPANARVLYAKTDTAGPSNNLIASVVIPPQSSQTIGLPELSGDPQLRNSFVIQSDAEAGTVLSDVAAVGSARFGTVQLLGKDEKQTENSGGHPWSIQNDQVSALLLFNHTDAAQWFNINVSAGRVMWQKGYQLRPFETQLLSINDLIVHHEKDRNGTILPQTVTEGEVSWFTVDPEKGTGRLLVANAERHLARNFSCSQMVTLCGATMEQFDENILQYDTGGLGPLLGQTCLSYYPCDYGNPYQTGGDGFSYFWDPGDPSIAPITGSAYDQSATFYGQNVGTAFPNGSIFSDQCQAQTQGTNNVQGPHHLVVRSDIISSQTSCPSSIKRSLSYQVVDINGNSVTTAMQVHEQFDNISTNTCGGPVTTAQTCYPITSGIIGDTLISGCPPDGSTPCGFTAQRQQWVWCANAGEVVLATPGDLSVYSNSISIGGNTTGFATGTALYP